MTQAKPLTIEQQLCQRLREESTQVSETIGTLMLLAASHIEHLRKTVSLLNVSPAQARALQHIVPASLIRSAMHTADSYETVAYITRRKETEYGASGNFEVWREIPAGHVKVATVYPDGHVEIELGYTREDSCPTEAICK